MVLDSLERKSKTVTHVDNRKANSERIPSWNRITFEIQRWFTVLFPLNFRVFGSLNLALNVQVNLLHVLPIKSSTLMLPFIFLLLLFCQFTSFLLAGEPESSSGDSQTALCLTSLVHQTSWLLCARKTAVSIRCTAKQSKRKTFGPTSPCRIYIVQFAILSPFDRRTHDKWTQNTRDTFRRRSNRFQVNGNRPRVSLPLLPN